MYANQVIPSFLFYKPRCLVLPKLGVDAGAGHQLVVRAFLDDRAVLNDDNPVKIFYRA